MCVNPLNNILYNLQFEQTDKLQINFSWRGLVFFGFTMNSFLLVPLGFLLVPLS